MIAISTACKEALIGIEVDGKRGATSLPSNCKHSENMLFTIDKMLDEMGKEFSQNEGFGVVIGPGSFTGIRIGVALVKGLLAGSDKKEVVAITTFDLMAYSYIKKIAPDKDFVCIINGLSGYYFICKYSHTGEKLGEEQMVTADDLSALDATLVGPEEEGLGTLQICPTAENLLDLCQERYAKGQTISAKEVCPMYLRKSQAESNLESKKLNEK